MTEKPNKVKQDSECFPKGEMHFPTSFWEPSPVGWYPRAVTEADHDRRRAYANERGYWYKADKGRAKPREKKTTGSKAQQLLANLTLAQKAELLAVFKGEI